MKVNQLIVMHSYLGQRNLFHTSKAKIYISISQNDSPAKVYCLNQGKEPVDSHFVTILCRASDSRLKVPSPGGRAQEVQSQSKWSGDNRGRERLSGEK